MNINQIIDKEANDYAELPRNINTNEQGVYQSGLRTGYKAGRLKTIDEKDKEIEMLKDGAGKMLVRIKELEDGLRDFADNYDCDTDAHRYGTTCRKCKSKQLINSEPNDERSVATESK